jgi:hypothetical protein
MQNSHVIVETTLVWMTTGAVVESPSLADGRVRFRGAGSGDLGAKFGTMPDDPPAVIPPSGLETPRRSVR